MAVKWQYILYTSQKGTDNENEPAADKKETYEISNHNVTVEDWHINNIIKLKLRVLLFVN